MFALAATLLVLLAAARVARAATNEWSTMDVAVEEEDDENFLDHYLSRPPVQWRDEWEQSPGGLRVDQGCLTAGIWYQQNDFKVRTPIGKRPWLDIGWEQRSDDEKNFEYLQLDFRYPTQHYGVLGWRFRPNYDKSQQDFAALWDFGDGHSPLQISAAFTIRDMFNKLWEFRQTLVGGHAEPYRAHPFEPSLRVVSRGARHRIEFEGAWLTPGRKTIIDPVPGNDGRSSLWGSRASLLGVRALGAWEGELRGDDEQVLSGRESVQNPGTGRVFRRRWTGEVAIRRHFTPAVLAEASWLYQDRSQDWQPPAGTGSFRAYDRMPALEVDWTMKQDLVWRAGLLYNRIAIDDVGSPPVSTYGSRKESRAFIGLQARFGRVSVRGIEGIELDSEPYPVAFHHDKGFLSLQTSF